MLGLGAALCCVVPLLVLGSACGSQSSPEIRLECQSIHFVASHSAKFEATSFQSSTSCQAPATWEQPDSEAHLARTRGRYTRRGTGQQEYISSISLAAWHTLALCVHALVQEGAHDCRQSMAARADSHTVGASSIPQEATTPNPTCLVLAGFRLSAVPFTLLAGSAYCCCCC